MASMVPVLSFVILLFTTFCNLGEARIITVGGSLDGWKVPQSNNTLSHWAESERFRVGDTLMFYVNIKNDSVLQVTKENYDSCNTTKPLQEYKQGNATVKLDVSGPHYFISGASTGNCGKGEKVIIVVQSPNHKAGVVPPTSPATPPTPASKKPHTAPAPAPSNTAGGLVAGNGIFWAAGLIAIIGLF